MIEAKDRKAGAKARWAACAGLLLCALGIATLWLSGTPDFPVAFPPGGENTASSSRSEIVFLLAGTLFVALARWRWAPSVGALLGAVFTVGFVADPAGLGNLLGASGAAAASGQALQASGALAALIAGTAATAAAYRTPAAARSRKSAA